MTFEIAYLGEAAGWLAGLAGFVVSMYGVYVGTTGGGIPLTFGVLVAGLCVSLFGVTVAITSRENRIPGSLAERMAEQSDENDTTPPPE